MTSRHLEVELLRLREENAKFCKALRINGRHARRIQRAYDAALLLAQWSTNFKVESPVVFAHSATVTSRPDPGQPAL